MNEKSKEERLRQEFHDVYGGNATTEWITVCQKQIELEQRDKLLSLCTDIRDALYDISNAIRKD